MQCLYSPMWQGSRYPYGSTLSQTDDEVGVVSSVRVRIFPQQDPHACHRETLRKPTLWVHLPMSESVALPRDQEFEFPGGPVARGAGTAL